MPDRDSSYLSGGGGSGSNLSEEGGSGSACATDCRVGSEGGVGSMDGGGSLGNGISFGLGGGAMLNSGLMLDGVCRDFIRNVCKRGKRCRFKHPDFNEVPDLGVQKNEFIFCHDYQNKECLRINCRFVHGTKEDEEYYKKNGELPLALRAKVAARLGLSPTDLPHSRGEVPICRDFLKGECQRGSKCKFRHVQKDYEYDLTGLGVSGLLGAAASVMVSAGSGIGAAGASGGASVGIPGLVGGVAGNNILGVACPGMSACRDASVAGVGVSAGVAGVSATVAGVSAGVAGVSAGVGTVSAGVGPVSAAAVSVSAPVVSVSAPAGPSGQRRFDRTPMSVYEPVVESSVFDSASLDSPLEQTALQIKRRRLESLRLADSSVGGHYDLGVQATLPTRPVEYRLLEEENNLLRKRVEELKKQVANLISTNEVLLEQNAQFRGQATVMTAAQTEQTLVPPVGAVSSYNHGIAQTHTTLSSTGLQPRPVTQQDLVASTGAPAAPPNNAAPPPHLNPEITPLSAALAQTIAQGMAPPVSMAPVAVSVAPVAVSMSMTQPLPGITMSHATTPMVSYPIASQSMRITTLPHIT
ncbi:zinc finger CCCH domain-containing protein 10 [Syngnathus scovelli]|uniref:zinc finger CCCH domain-containing protein 10 n=1 Tax=Syngnathus scovelli TaxID=161590 RepID=UPI0021104AED|nr:zinc finger CCCH domain-containing protein 10 [Syngnathus scovelli]